MKKLILISGFIFFSLNSFCQGNLQFNQVLTFSGALTGSTTISPTYTVPAGKVWKIEYLSETRKRTGSTGNPYFGAVINGTAQNIEIGSNPIWLKEGNTIYYRNYGFNLDGLDGWGTLLQSYLISVIEYNIIP
jgi:hypothetical protein